MKKIWKTVLCILFLFILSPCIAFAGTLRTQSFNLKAGWNAVFLEIEAMDSKPDSIFKDTPIIQVLTFYPKSSSVEFIKDPEEVAWNKEGWHSWVQPNRPEAILTNLYGLQAGQAYLIFCTEDYIWEYTGESKLINRTWQPYSYNFTGFYVDPNAPPTFSQFFAGSKSSANIKIYTLMNNKWVKVLEPWEETIGSGIAYWVWYEEELDYPGPLEVKIQGVKDEILFLPEITELEIQIINRSPDPLSFTLEQVAGVDNANQVPLSLVKTDLTAITINTYANFTSYEPANSLKPGEAHTVRFAIRQNEMSIDIIRSLLMITDDLGNRLYLPMQAEKLQIK